MAKDKVINKKILLLTFSDVFSWGPYYIVSSILSIYLSKKLGVDTIKFIGIGTAIYYMTRAIVQIPVGHISDKLKTYKDEAVMLEIGLILMGLTFILYPLITKPVHYYLLQLMFGTGCACNLTNWRKLFAASVTRGEEGRQYAFYEAAISISTSLIALIIGIIANISEKSFNIVLVVSGIIMSLSSIFIFIYNRKLIKR